MEHQHSHVHGKAFGNINFENSAFAILNHPLKINEEAFSTQGTGGHVWDCAVVLSKYFEHSSDLQHSTFKGKRVIELGSGTGLVGISASIFCPSSILLTDLPELLPILNTNVQNNKNLFEKYNVQVEIKSLDWNEEKPNLGKFDIILCSDLVFHVKVLKPLCKILNELSNENTLIYMAHKSRHDSVDEALFPALEEYFDGDEIELEDHHPDFQHERIRLFKITKRKEIEQK